VGRTDGARGGLEITIFAGGAVTVLAGVATTGTRIAGLMAVDLCDAGDVVDAGNVVDAGDVVDAGNVALARRTGSGVG
jgi:hypothetical protein